MTATGYYNDNSIETICKKVNEDRHVLRQKAGKIMKYIFNHDENSRKGKRRKLIVANKKLFRRAVGCLLVLVTLLAAVQTGVFATSGMNTESKVVVGAQEEQAPEQAETTQEGNDPVAVESAEASPEATPQESQAVADQSNMELPLKMPGNSLRSVSDPTDINNAQLFAYLFIGDAEQHYKEIPVVDGHIEAPEAPDASMWPEGAAAFRGWSHDKEGKIEFKTEDIIVENLNLYAQFDMQSYVITFEAQDGSVLGTANVKPGETVQDPGIVITPPSGQSFLYWANKETGEQFTFGTTVQTDVTLIPKFSSSYYVYFYSEGTQIDPVWVTGGEPVAKPEADPTRAGYDFLHWSAEPGGEAYDFSAPVTDTLRLHAVWQGQTVPFTAVIWMEKPNLLGTPSWPEDYMSFRVVKNGDLTNKNEQIYAKCEAIAGTEITDIDVSIRPRIADTAFFHYAKTVPTIIQGNGQSVVNVLYDRNIYTMNFVVSYKAGQEVVDLSGGEKLTRTYAPESKIEWEWTQETSAGWTKKTFNREPMQQVAYSFQAKYEQDISSLWPSQNINTKFTAYAANGNVSASQLLFWQPEGATMGSQSSAVTKRLILTPDLIPFEYGDGANGKALAWYAIYGDKQQKQEVNYWYGVLDGQTGVPSKNNAAAGSYVKDESLSQTIVTEHGATVYGKDLPGMKLAGTCEQTNSDGIKVYDFYYARKTVNLVFNTGGGSAVSAVNNVKHGQDMQRYKPQIDPVKNNAVFDGWYYDDTFKKKVSWDTDTIVASVYTIAGEMQDLQTVTLYAKWQSNDHIVSFYDNRSSVGSGTPIARQGVANGAYVDYSTPVTIEVEGKTYPLMTGKTVPGYGEFLGWYWLMNGTEQVAAYPDMPINRNYDMYAVWKTEGFAITYAPGEAATGNIPTDDKSYAIGSQTRVQANTGNLTVQGKTFSGWKNEADGMFYYPNQLITIKGNTTLTAQFVDPNNYYTVTFSSGYAESTQGNVVRYVAKEGSLNLLAASTFTRDGYAFKGWSSNGTIYQAGDKYTVSGNVEFTAQWKQTVAPASFFVTVKGWVDDPLKPQADIVYVPVGDPKQAMINIPDEMEDKTSIDITGTELTSFVSSGAPTKEQIQSALGKLADKIYMQSGQKVIFKNGDSITWNALKYDQSTYATKGYHIDGYVEAVQVFDINFAAGNNGTLEGLTEFKDIVSGTAWDQAIKVPVPKPADGYYFVGWSASFPDAVTQSATYTAVFAPKTSITVTAIDGNKEEYDGLPLTAKGVTEDSLASLKSGDTIEVTMTPDSVQTNAGEHANEIAEVHIYRVINGVKTEVTNEYAVDPKPGMLTVGKKKVTVTPDDVSKVYGNADPDRLTATVGETINGDALDYTVTRMPGEDVVKDGYKLFVTSGINENYEIIDGEGTFMILQRPITITANDNGKVIGGTDPPLTAWITDLGTGVAPNYTLKRDEGETVNRYPITVTAKPEDNPNYHINPVPGEFVISPLTTQVKITPNGNTKVYGVEKDPDLNATVIGVPDGSPMPNYELVREPGDAVGTYKIKVVLKDNPNYTNIDANATADFVITPKPVTIEINSLERVYGDETPEVFSAQVKDLVGEDVLDYTLTRERPEVKNADTYKIDAIVSTTSEVNKNYTISVEKNNLVIKPRPVTIKADDKSITYGDKPAFTASFQNGTSLVEGDTLQYGFVCEGKNASTTPYPINIELGANPNYVVTALSGELTIGKKTVKVTPGTTEVVYGEAFDPNQDVQIKEDGVLSGDSLSYDVVREKPENKNVGEYGLTIVDKGNENYIIEGGTGKVTVTPRPLTITPGNGGKKYKDPEPNPLTDTVTFDNLAYNDTIVYTLSRAEGEQANRQYNIYVNVDKNAYPNYVITTKTGTFTIMPSTTKVAIMPDYQEMIYGETEPQLTAKITGAPEGDINYTLIRTGDKTAGTYKVKVVLGENPNYTTSEISCLEADFVVKPRPVTIQADDKIMQYGTTIEPELSATALTKEQDSTSMGLVKGDTIDCTLDRALGKDVGNYQISIFAQENKNYKVTTKPGTFKIEPKPIIVTADSFTKSYGDPDPQFTAKAAVLVPGDTLNCLLRREEGTDAGKEYAIFVQVVEDPVSKNYKIDTVNGKLTIKQKKITVTPDSTSKVYGDPDPGSYSVSAPDLVPGDTLDYTIDRTPGEDVGGYDLTLKPGNNPNYEIVGGIGKLTITPRLVTITAANTGKIYGGQDPALSAEVTSGSVVNGDKLNYTVERAAGEDAKTYPINVVLGENKNYTVTGINGTFTIAPKSVQVLIVPDNTGKEYGRIDPALTATQIGADSSAKLDYTLSRTSGENAGTYEINVTLGNNPNYVLDSIQVAKGTFTVTPKQATITVANATKVAGAQDPVFRADVEGVIGNDVLNFTLNRAEGEEAGSYAINATLGDNPNYAVAIVPGTLTITDAPAGGGATAPPATPGGGAGTTTPAADPGNAAENAAQLVTIDETDVPLAAGDTVEKPPTVQIGDTKVPLASAGLNASWALLNLILAFVTGIIMLVLLFTWFFGKSKDEEEEAQNENVTRAQRSEEENSDRKLKRKGIVRLFSIVVTLIAVIAFILTEDVRLPMVLIDQWTWLMIVIAAVQVIVAIFSKKSRKEYDEEEKDTWAQHI